MGVDFYYCEVCENSRYEEYVGNCQGCGKGICTACVTNDDINSDYEHLYGLKYNSSEPELMKKYEEEGFHIYNENGESYYEDDEIIDDSSISSKYCPFCQGIMIDRDAVLDFLLLKYNLKIEDVWKEIIK